MGGLTDQNFIEPFNAIINRFSQLDLLAENPPLLAHYTSVKALEGILSLEEIWFSNPLFMNDLQEMRFGLNQGARLFSNAHLLRKAAGTEARAAIVERTFWQYYQNFDDQDAFDTYVFCLSEHDRSNTDGLLSMWRAYGQQGDGACLVFDTAKLTMVPKSPFLIAKVSYGSDKDRLSQLQELLQQWAQILEGTALPDEKLHLASHCAFSAKKTFALTTKHSGFSEEAEWRVIFHPERDTTGALKEFLGYHIGDRGVEPKLKYPVGHMPNISAPDLSLDRLLDKIILGPSLSSPLAKRSVQRMLEKINRANFVGRLHTSGIPIRPV